MGNIKNCCMKFRTRKGKLEHKLTEELSKTKPKLSRLLEIIEDFESDNINTIEKLKKKKTATLRKVNGALKQSINAHGPITKDLIGSASKRVYGSILEAEEEQIDNRIQLRGLLIGFISASIIFLGFYLLM